MVKIQCTYEDCYRTFDTEKAMKVHKTKDRAHDFYCKKCDVDCVDDTELLFHQITGSKHTACPVCGREFKSEGGRDRHVEIDHVPTQKIDCVGCEKRFERAASLMAHIERNECTVIKSHHFHRQRAEKQIISDVWTAAMSTTGGSTLASPTGSNIAALANLTLLDDERAWENSDWQGRPQVDTESVGNEVHLGAGIGDTMSALSINDRYPALISPKHTSPDAKTNGAQHGETRLGDNLIDLTDSARKTRQLSEPWSQPGTSTPSQATTPAAPNVWETRSVQSANLVDTKSQSTNLLDRDPARDTDSRATWGSKWDHKNTAIYFPSSESSSHVDYGGNTSQPNQQVQVVRQVHMPSYLNADRFYNPMFEQFVCPSPHCGLRVRTADAFYKHLTSPTSIHMQAQRQVTCPSCLKKFRSTTALLAHCESGSQKCKIRDAVDYDAVIREISAGILSVDGYTDDGGVKYAAQQVEDW